MCARAPPARRVRLYVRDVWHTVSHSIDVRCVTHCSLAQWVGFRATSGPTSCIVCVVTKHRQTTLCAPSATVRGVECGVSCSMALAHSMERSYGDTHTTPSAQQSANGMVSQRRAKALLVPPDIDRWKTTQHLEHSASTTGAGPPTRSTATAESELSCRNSSSSSCKHSCRRPLWLWLRSPWRCQG